MEDLRRKHIQTLEVLQNVSDENLALREENATLKDVKWSELPDLENKEGGNSEQSELAQLQTLLGSQEVELRACNDLATGLKTKLADAATGCKEYCDKYGAEKALAHQLKKQVDIAGELMKDLRKQLESANARNSSEDDGLASGVERIGILESKVTLMTQERDIMTGERDEALREVGRLSTLLDDSEEVAERKTREAKSLEVEVESDKRTLEKKLDDVELLVAEEKKVFDERMNELAGEVERKRAEGEAVGAENVRISQKNLELMERISKLEADAKEALLRPESRVEPAAVQVSHAHERASARKHAVETRCHICTASRAN